MLHFIKNIWLVIGLLAMTSCQFFEPAPQNPSVPLIYFSFNGTNTSNGIESFKVFGNQKMSYAAGIQDSALDLSIHSLHRKPVVMNTKGNFIPQEQQSFSVIVWVKMDKDDSEVYGIAGNKGLNTSAESGWIISSTSDGAWQFEVSDGYHYQKYKATPQRQRINDGKWHQLGFLMDKHEQMARTFFDGKQVGVLSLEGIQSFDADYNLFIGCDPASRDYTKDTFNGLIDEVGVWSKKLEDAQFREAYSYIKKERLASVLEGSDSIRVMTWNIWNGGQQMGKTVGLNIIADNIKKHQVDIVALQEEFGSGEYIADKLDYYLYRRSENLCLISRFPLGKHYNIYKPMNSGGVEVLVNDETSLLVCPVWLNFQPNINGLLMNTSIPTDTIIDIENDTRANEATFILSELDRLNNDMRTNAVILAGDFNSGSHLDWTLRNKQNKYQKEIPFPATQKVMQKGFIDAYREMWPDEILHSGNTYSPLFKEGYQDRIDFIFYKGKTLKAINATVINSTTQIFPSDHAAVVVTFKL